MTALPAVVYVGICTTAHNNDVLGTDPSQLQYLNIADYDNYNSSYVAVPAIKLAAPRVVGNNVTITWAPNVGHLLASPATAGPNVNWQPVTGGTGGSVTIPLTGTPMFFRVVNP